MKETVSGSLHMNLPKQSGYQAAPVPMLQHGDMQANMSNLRIEEPTLGSLGWACHEVGDLSPRQVIREEGVEGWLTPGQVFAPESFGICASAGERFTAAVSAKAAALT